MLSLHKKVCRSLSNSVNGDMLTFAICPNHVLAERLKCVFTKRG
jgi:hypothetical protein